MTSSGCGGTPAGTKWLPSGPSEARPQTRLARTGRVAFHVLDAVLAVTLAPACAACQRPLDSPLAGAVCEPCWDAVHPLTGPACTTCGVPWTISRGASPERPCAACRRRPSAVDWGRVAADYSGALRDIVHAFKYEGRRSLAVPLGRLLANAGASVLAGAECVVPVPLHTVKRLRRGFNQAADLATALGPPVVPALWRVRNTRAQVGLPAATRRRNVRDAFVPSPWQRSRRWERAVTDRVVVLVDDVRTTGATLHECARVLKQMGAREVRSLALAQAPVKGLQA
jgi:ComF family protein